MFAAIGTPSADKEKKMIRFGTGGWRAVIGDDFIKSNIVRVAQALCDMIKEEKKTEGIESIRERKNRDKRSKKKRKKF